MDVDDGALLAAAADGTARADGGSSARSHGNLDYSVSFAVGGSCAHANLGTTGVGSSDGGGRGVNAGGICLGSR